MIGCSYEISKRFSCCLNAFRQSERNIGKSIVKAVICNDTERIKRNRISDFERRFCCAADGRQAVYFDRISNVVRVALAVGCTAPNRNCITACNRSALLYGRNRERLSETIDSRNTEQFVADGIGCLHVVFRRITSNCRCAVNFHVCDFDFHFVAGNIRSRNYDCNAIACTVICFFYRNRNNTCGSDSIGCDRIPKSRIERIGKIEIIFFSIIRKRRRAVYFDIAYRLYCINTVKTGRNQSDGNGFTCFKRSADYRNDNIDGISVRVNCRCVVSVGRSNDVVYADFRRFIIRKRYGVFNPLCVKRNILRRHRGEPIFICQRTVRKPTDKRFFNPSRFTRCGYRRAVILRDRINIAAAVRYEGNRILIDVPFGIKRRVFGFIPYSYGMSFRICILRTRSANSVIPTGKRISRARNVGRKRERRTEGNIVIIYRGHCCRA